jgi:hypothetical protein
LFGAVILAVSLVALAHFLVFYVRSMLVACSEVKLSSEVEALMGMPEAALTGNDFGQVMALMRATPGDCVNRQEMLVVYVYHAMLTALVRYLPGLAHWAESDRRACTHFAAVTLDCRLTQ